MGVRVTGADGARAGHAERRSRLRVYQEQLLEKMQAARNGGGASIAQLGLEIGGTRFLVDLTEVGEIVAPAPLISVPLTQPWYLGLANVRGSLLGVVDLARYLGEDASPFDMESAAAPRLVVFAPALGLNCALLASQVFGLRQTGAMERDGNALRDADGMTWTPLSLAALAQEERFLDVGIHANQH